MPRGNPKNLVPNEARTPKERQENARKAGKASGEARRRKRDMREAANQLLNIPHYDSWIWTATPWYCGDKDSDTGAAGIGRLVDADGMLCNSGTCESYAVAPACVLNPKFLNLRQHMAYVEGVSE